MAMTKEEIELIADMVTENITNAHKEVLTSKEAAKYMGISLSYLYKLTMNGNIPHYKPNGEDMLFQS